MANIPGTSGNDTRFGTAGADIINRDGDPLSFPGTRGRDTLFGGAGHDTLYGGSGDDHLNGGLGNDVMNGGAGSDTVYYTNIVNGGTTYIGASSGVTVNLNLTSTQNTGGGGRRHTREH